MLLFAKQNADELPLTVGCLWVLCHRVLFLLLYQNLLGALFLTVKLVGLIAENKPL